MGVGQGTKGFARGAPLTGLLQFSKIPERLIPYECQRIIRKGKYSLALADGNEKILDFVYFEVTGREEDQKN
jgi:hypothetical protein